MTREQNVELSILLSHDVRSARLERARDLVLASLRESTDPGIRTALRLAWAEIEAVMEAT